MPSESTWKLQDAKARFSEVLRRAKVEGPQHVTVHGRNEAVIVSIEDFRRLTETLEQPRSGKLLVAALRGLKGAEIVRESVLLPVRSSPTFE